jgi:branched-subunit amino acid ABC-type transport system permease component
VGQVIVETILRGGILAPLALGMTLVYGVSRFANVAQVEFATLGAYGTLVVAGVIGGGLLGQAALTVVIVGLLAVAMYHGVFAFLVKRGPVMAMIGSLSVSIVIRALVQTIAGPGSKQLDLPLERGVDILGATVVPSAMWSALIAAVAVLAVVAFLRLAPLGHAIRAVSSDPDLAAAAGIDTRRVAQITWFIGGALGAIAGIALAVQSEVKLEMGFSLLIPVFGATLLGGIGAVGGGAVLAAYMLAFIEGLVLNTNLGSVLGGDVQLPVEYRPAIAFVVFIAVLVVRPRGLFGRRLRRG